MEFILSVSVLSENSLPHFHNFAGLGVLGSDLVLNNLELRLETLQELIPTPLTFEFTRGYVRVRIV